MARLKNENALQRMERDIQKRRRRNLPKSRCEVRRSQYFAISTSSPFYFPGFVRISPWILRMAQKRYGPIKQDSSSGGQDFGCPQANTRYIRLGAVATRSFGKWLRVSLWKVKHLRRELGLAISANGGLFVPGVKSRVIGRFQSSEP